MILESNDYLSKQTKLQVTKKKEKKNSPEFEKNTILQKKFCWSLASVVFSKEKKNFQQQKKMPSPKRNKVSGLYLTSTFASLLFFWSRRQKKKSLFWFFLKVAELVLFFFRCCGDKQ